MYTGRTPESSLCEYRSFLDLAECPQPGLNRQLAELQKACRHLAINPSNGGRPRTTSSRNNDSRPATLH